MKEIKMFEIPIYSMSEAEYKKRCYKYINKNASMTTLDNYESFYSYLENSYYKKRPWKYNQIVGYITISFKDNSIWFDEYCTFDKRIRAIADVKHIIQNMMLNGYHFYLRTDMKDSEIKNEIIRWIESIDKYIMDSVYKKEKSHYI